MAAIFFDVIIMLFNSQLKSARYEVLQQTPKFVITELL
jgi:hypothetical protein